MDRGMATHNPLVVGSIPTRPTSHGQLRCHTKMALGSLRSSVGPHLSNGSHVLLRFIVDTVVPVPGRHFLGQFRKVGDTLFRSCLTPLVGEGRVWVGPARRRVKNRTCDVSDLSDRLGPLVAESQRYGRRRVHGDKREASG